MDEAPRTDPPAEGEQVHLSEGRAHWCREGAPDGVPVVLVHGATVPSWEFDALVPPLIEAGFQTLRFALYGHGRSDRLPGAYTFERFTRQAIEVVESTGFARPAILLGHSFGAAVAANVAVLRPDLAMRVVLVAPMLDFSSTSGWAHVFRPRVLGELAMRLIGVPGLIRRRRRRYAAIGASHLTDRFIGQASDAGFGRAIASMFHTGALGDKSETYAGLRSCAREVLVLTGDRDGIIPPEHVERLRALLPSHTHVSVPADHSLLLTHPQVVVAAIRDWLSERR